MSNKKYYLCVTPFFPTEETVYGSYVYDQVKAIRRNSDLDVMVFRPKSCHDKATSYEYDGIKVFLFPSLFMPSYFFNGLTNPYNGHAFVTALKKNGINLNDIAVVHCHTATYACYGIAVKKLSPQIKVVLQHHDKDPYQILNGKWAGFLPNLLFRAIVNIRNFKKIDTHICISEAVKNNLLAFPKPGKEEVYDPYMQQIKKIEWLRNDTSDFSTYVLYNGVDTCQFQSTAKRNHPLFIVGCIGNYQNLKDHSTLLRAINSLHERKMIPNMRVRLIGHGPLEKDLRNYVSEHKLGEIVCFEKEVDHSELPAFYNSLDLFVLPSIFEGFGCVYIEAAACGVPYMMCKGQGAAEYIPESEASKWLIEKGDSASLADKIYQFYINRYEQKLSKTFEIDELIKVYLRIVIL